jgi:hypothetical protein
LHHQIFIINVYVASLACVSKTMKIIPMEKAQSMRRDCIFIVIGDFNIDIHSNNLKRKQL